MSKANTTLKDQLNHARVNALQIGSRVGHLYVYIDTFLDEAVPHPDNRDEDKNIAANPHHQRGDFALSKVCIQMGYSEESDLWYIISGNCRWKSWRASRERKDLSEELKTQPICIQVMSYPTDKEMYLDLQYNGGKGVSWPPAELSKAMKNLSPFIESCPVFGELKIDSIFSTQEKKDISKTYIERAEELTFMFKTIQKEVDKGVPLSKPRRKRDEVVSVHNVGVFQIGILKGVYEYLKEEGSNANFELIKTFIHDLVWRKNTNITKGIFEMLIKHDNDKKDSRERLKHQSAYVQHNSLGKK